MFLSPPPPPLPPPSRTRARPGWGLIIWRILPPRTPSSNFCLFIGCRVSGFQDIKCCFFFYYYYCFIFFLSSKSRWHPSSNMFCVFSHFFLSVLVKKKSQLLRLPITGNATISLTASFLSKQICNRSTLFSSRHIIESIVLRLLMGGFVFCTFHSKILLVFSVTPFKISKLFDRSSPESGKWKEVNIQRPSSRFGSKE